MEIQLKELNKRRRVESRERVDLAVIAVDPGVRSDQPANKEINVDLVDKNEQQNTEIVTDSQMLAALGDGASEPNRVNAETNEEHIPASQLEVKDQVGKADRT